MMFAWQRLNASGDEYVVLLDHYDAIRITPDMLPRLVRLGSDQPASGVIRALPTSLTAEAETTLSEDPAAVWWCETRSPSGRIVGTSGNGARILVDALVRWNLLAFEDRRDAIPVGSPDGVRDVLAGRGGYAVDLGRWRLLQERPGLYVIGIGNERVSVCVEGDTSLVFPNTGVSTQVTAEEVRIEKGVAHADTIVHDPEHTERGSSSLAAAATALVLRHRGPLDTPHHWAIHFRGGDVAVRMFATEDGEHVSVSGPVNLVSSGDVEIPLKT